MIKSKSWNWDIVDKNDFYWNSPAPEVYYLAENWKSKGFKTVLDVGCGYGVLGITLKYFDKCDYVDMVDINERAVLLTKENIK